MTENHDHGHVHLLRHGPPMPRRAMRFAIAVLVITAVGSLIGMVLLWPHAKAKSSLPDGGGATQVTGVVVSVEQKVCPPADPGTPTQRTVCGVAIVRLTSGADKGHLVDTDLPGGPGSPTVRPNDDVVLTQTDGALTGYQYQIADHQRSSQLWVLLGVFVLAVIAFGRLRGIAALAGLAISFAVLLLFIVPAILAGKPPIVVAIVGSAVIVLSVLYLTNGFTVPTSVAVLGTLASLTLTGVLAAGATAAMHLTGIGGEEDLYLSMAYQQVNLQGLLLAGILIGALGVLDDVAVTQAVTVNELAAANPTLTTRQLYKAGARIGRAHINSVINTLVLAYAGASLPMLLLLTAGGQPVGQVLTTQQMGQEIVRSLVGTIGLIAAVPITTWLGAITARRLPAKAEPKQQKEKTPPAEIGWLDEDPDAVPWAR